MQPQYSGTPKTPPENQDTVVLKKGGLWWQVHFHKCMNKAAYKKQSEKSGGFYNNKKWP